MTIPTISNIYLKIAVVVIALAVIGVCKFYFKVADTNPVEEIAEEVIKDETGYDVEPIIAKV